MKAFRAIYATFYDAVHHFFAFPAFAVWGMFMALISALDEGDFSQAGLAAGVGVVVAIFLAILVAAGVAIYAVTGIPIWVVTPIGWFAGCFGFSALMNLQDRKNDTANATKI